jgi:molybdenum cofactor guanylyltransferase
VKPDVTALILAGGKATRFGGIAKHELVVDGETIFARQVKVLAPRVAEILVSGPPIDGYRNVRDSVEDIGPLAGIAAGLAACRTSWLLVVAGDMPHLSGALIDRLIERCIPGLDAIGIRIDGLPEPLVCVLHRDVCAIVERRIAERRFKASGLLTDEGLHVYWIEDVDRGALRNVNTPEDL